MLFISVLRVCFSKGNWNQDDMFGSSLKNKIKWSYGLRGKRIIALYIKLSDLRPFLQKFAKDWKYGEGKMEMPFCWMHKCIQRKSSTKLYKLHWKVSQNIILFDIFSLKMINHDLIWLSLNLTPFASCLVQKLQEARKK